MAAKAPSQAAGPAAEADPLLVPPEVLASLDELLAADDAAAASFYSDVVGYTVRVIDRRGGQYTLLSADDRDRAGIFPNPTDWEPQWITHFGVADPAAAAARAASLGGEVLDSWPIYVPIIDVDKARNVVVVKRSLSPGFAGIPNPLFAADNCLMMFGDGKKAMTELVHWQQQGYSLITPTVLEKKHAIEEIR